MSDIPQYFYDPIVVPSDSSMSLSLRFKPSNDQLSDEPGNPEILPTELAISDQDSQNRNTAQHLPNIDTVPVQVDPSVRCSVCETQAGSDAYVQALSATSHYYAHSQSASPLIVSNSSNHSWTPYSPQYAANANINPEPARYQTGLAPYTYQSVATVPTGQHGVLIPPKNAALEFELFSQGDVDDSSDDESDDSSIDSGLLEPRQQEYDLDYEPYHLESDLNALQEVISDASVKRDSAEYQDNTTWEFDKINNLLTCLTSHVNKVCTHHERLQKRKSKAGTLDTANQPNFETDTENVPDLFDEFQAAQIFLRCDRTCRVYLSSDKIVNITRLMYCHDHMFSSPCIIYDFLVAIGTGSNQDTVYGISNLEQEEDLWEGLRKWRPQIDVSTLQEGTLAYWANRFVNSTQEIMKRVNVVKRRRCQDFDSPQENDSDPPSKRLASGLQPRYVPNNKKHVQAGQASTEAATPAKNQISRKKNPTASFHMVRTRDSDIKWLAFHCDDCVNMEYTIRCDIKSVDITQLSEKFKTENCVYPRAYMSREQHEDTAPNDESFRNQIGWQLADLNPCLRGKRRLLERAVDCWERSEQDAYASFKLKEESSQKSAASLEYETQLLLLENQGMHRFIQAIMESIRETKHKISLFRQSGEPPASNPHAKPKPPSRPRQDAREQTLSSHSATDDNKTAFTSRPERSNHAVQDYNTQLKLLEKQNQARFPNYLSPNQRDYAFQLMLLEQQNKKRLLMKQREEKQRQLSTQFQNEIQELAKLNPVSLPPPASSSSSSEPVTYYPCQTAAYSAQYNGRPTGSATQLYAPFAAPNMHGTPEPAGEPVYYYQQAAGSMDQFAAPSLPHLPSAFAPPDTSHYYTCTSRVLGNEDRKLLSSQAATSTSASTGNSTFGTQIWSPPNACDNMSNAMKTQINETGGVEVIKAEEEDDDDDDDDVTIAGDSDADDNERRPKAVPPLASTQPSRIYGGSPAPSSSSSDDYVIVGGCSDRETSSDSEMEGMHVVALGDYDWEEQE